jgi:hypothetical protein
LKTLDHHIRENSPRAQYIVLSGVPSTNEDLIESQLVTGFSAPCSLTSASCPFNCKTTSRASSFSGAKNDVDADAGAGIGGAGDLDLGDFTRLEPLLLGSTVSLFVPRTLTLRVVDTKTRRVRHRASRIRTNVRSPKGRTINVLVLDHHIIGLDRPLSLVRVTLFYRRTRLALLR